MPQMSPFAAFILFLVLSDLQSSFHAGFTQNRSKSLQSRAVSGYGLRFHAGMGEFASALPH